MRLVPWGQIPGAAQARGRPPISWLRFSSRTAPTTTWTASKSSAADSCRGGFWGFRGVPHEVLGSPQPPNPHPRNPRGFGLSRTLSFPQVFRTPLEFSGVPSRFLGSLQGFWGLHRVLGLSQPPVSLPRPLKLWVPSRLEVLPHFWVFPSKNFPTPPGVFRVPRGFWGPPSPRGRGRARARSSRARTC